MTFPYFDVYMLIALFDVLLLALTALIPIIIVILSWIILDKYFKNLKFNIIIGIFGVFYMILGFYHSNCIINKVPIDPILDNIFTRLSDIMPGLSILIFAIMFTLATERNKKI